MTMKDEGSDIGSFYAARDIIVENTEATETEIFRHNYGYEFEIWI